MTMKVLPILPLLFVLVLHHRVATVDAFHSSIQNSDHWRKPLRRRDAETAMKNHWHRHTDTNALCHRTPLSHHCRRHVLGIAATLLIGAVAPIVTEAAPPIAIIAEELGYFPVTNRVGETVYVPQRVRRESSLQAVRLAQRLSQQGAYMAGTYWCPHTSRQKELFGRTAWQLEYVECASAGYQGNAKLCAQLQIQGYPTWVFPDGKLLSGERSLEALAEAVGMKNFRPEQEVDLPPLSGAACK
jgi:hypothetical protein